MKFFKKQSVAIVLTALIVALCCMWGYSRDHMDLLPDSGGTDRASGDSNLNYYLSQIDDGAGLFSSETVDRLARKNLILNNTYHSTLSVKTVEFLGGTDIRTYAEDAAADMNLGGRDLFLLLDAESQDWYVTYGNGIASFIESSRDLPDLFRSCITPAFWEEGASDSAILELFDEMQDWYGDTLPADNSSNEGSIYHTDSKTPSITFGAILSGILLTLLANLWWIILVLIALSIADQLRFKKYFAKYPPGTSPVPMFHPFLFWHRAGSSWYAHRMEEAMEEAAEEEDEPFDESDPNEASGSSWYQGQNQYRQQDHYQRGPGYSTDPNEPGPFGPQSYVDPQVDLNSSMSPSLKGQFVRLIRGVVDLFLQFLDLLGSLFRRM